MATTLTSSRATLTHERSGDGSLRVVVGGTWHTADGRPGGFDAALADARGADVRRIEFSPDDLQEWDTSLVSAMQTFADVADSRGLEISADAMPEGVRRLFDLSRAVPEKSDARRGDGDIGILTRIGQSALGAEKELKATLSFIGDVVIAFVRVFTGRGIMRWQDFLVMAQRAGVEALGIACLVSFLLGLILAFISAIQLETYGAAIYVADLVGIGMVRDMGALMTAIVMAGRSGAAYAAEIGSMRSTQELDALEAAGISPIEFLVVPRIMAIALMLPILTVFADVAGIVGGAVVGIGLMDLSFTSYFNETVKAVSLGHLYGGLLKGFCYGILVGMAGCMRGMQSGASSLAVGAAATSAVVTALVWIIAACGIFQVIQYALGLP